MGESLDIDECHGEILHDDPAAHLCSSTIASDLYPKPYRWFCSPAASLPFFSFKLYRG